MLITSPSARYILGFFLKALCTELLQTVQFHLTQSYISDKCITSFFFFFSFFLCETMSTIVLITYAQSALNLSPATNVPCVFL